ncbi:hypothetical protein VNO77_30548 [Canavalia gladiata]|uniref:Uncharacterized protein n=1 Tax=Canavalia gladiata TaxID=3824 RepID=A0AAN9KN46_CANGL
MFPSILDCVAYNIIMHVFSHCWDCNVVFTFLALQGNIIMIYQTFVAKASERETCSLTFSVFSLYVICFPPLFLHTPAVNNQSLHCDISLSAATCIFPSVRQCLGDLSLQCHRSLLQFLEPFSVCVVMLCRSIGWQIIYWLLLSVYSAKSKFKMVSKPIVELNSTLGHPQLSKNEPGSMDLLVELTELVMLILWWCGVAFGHHKFAIGEHFVVTAIVPSFVAQKAGFHSAILLLQRNMRVKELLKKQGVGEDTSRCRFTGKL